MTITRAFIQAHDGLPSDEAFFKAFDGFKKRRVPCHLFDAAELASLPLERDTLVAGAIRVVEEAMGLLGMRVPEADNLPERLAKYRGRKVWRSTWGELRKGWKREQLFVKPLRKNKGFPSLALCDEDDLAAASKRDAAEEVLVSEYVLFASEWRCFVVRGNVVNLSHYSGDPCVFPDAAKIKAALADLGDAAPAGFGIDFGVLLDGKTVLVEMNDGYSLGSYGCYAPEYAEMLEARWEQLAAI